MSADTRMAALRRLVASGYPVAGRATLLLWCLGAVAFLYPFSLVFAVGGVLPPEYSWTATVVIMLFGATTFVSELRYRSLASAATMLLLLSGALFTVEWVGVTTGFPFGPYAYTEALGFGIAGVPAAIAVAWYATAVTSWHLASWCAGPARQAGPVITGVAAGVLTVALDMVLEPFATRVQQYWAWEGEMIPVQNYVSWFVLGGLAGGILAASSRISWSTRRHMVTVSLAVYGLQFLLFVLAGLVRGHGTPVMAAVGLLAAAVATLRLLSPRAPAQAGEKP